MTDQQIYKGLQQGDTATIDYLYRKYAPSLLGYVLKNSGAESEGYELFHTTILKIWENIKHDKYQLTSSRFEAYFFTIATNTWIDELRQRKKQRTEPIDALHLHATTRENDDLKYKIASDRRLTMLFEVLNDWQDSICKNLIELFHLKNVSLLDIAEQLKFDYNSLRKRIFDCRKKLARLTIERLGLEGETDDLFF